jgi:hypothetical protein
MVNGEWAIEDGKGDRMWWLVVEIEGKKTCNKKRFGFD